MSGKRAWWLASLPCLGALLPPAAWAVAERLARPHWGPGWWALPASCGLGLCLGLALAAPAARALRRAAASRAETDLPRPGGAAGREERPDVASLVSELRAALDSLAAEREDELSRLREASGDALACLGEAIVKLDAARHLVLSAGVGLREALGGDTARPAPAGGSAVQENSESEGVGEGACAGECLS
ncbi:hypothetical protein [Ammonifex thiophilus]|uniref:Uncharacterized protein n=1 Tax=Ammonifex thiophilus TaxID=444093 RepID=A0A3D8P298_9THEO|nr:hypothetical protein [Ammonifex thiophilus]RDV82341.1 hypothetical protein DXX99_07980 [Ammonifex thiophilus]